MDRGKEDRLLYDLFRAYYDARKHKRNTRSQLDFEFNLEENLVRLYDELSNRTYRVGTSVCFITNVPVKREVFAAHFRDRVIHHLVYNYLSPLFERVFITDSYSCRVGKGTLYGIERCEHHLRSCSDNWKRTCYVLKLDIRGYFMHINRAKLYGQIMELLEKYACRRNPEGKCWKDVLDYDLLEYLIREIVFNDPTLNCEMRGSRKEWEGLPPDKSLFHVAKGCGLPIGNLTSQLFSNVYLNALDQYIKRTLGEKYYGRYVDDFFILSADKNHLLSLLAPIRDFLTEELGLTLHPHKVFVQNSRHGFAFLGAFIKPYRRYIRHKTRQRICKRLRGMNRYLSRYHSNLCRDELQYIVSIVNSYLGHMQHMSCYRFKGLLIERNGSFVHIGRFQGFKFVSC